MYVPASGPTILLLDFINIMSMKKKIYIILRRCTTDGAEETVALLQNTQ